ncbi:MAG: Squalene/phytoene synthase [Tardiphaga sp.]|jgi:squalene synthase HpnC|uniref:squalene synthase HpnC n=1 Tax=Tardiphaga sp. TaxID=1926292 RepID=UPI0026059130|nr:squalene synthase HpnC [Tardiphaga sp.]MDB5504913.1 Squalene/phytoene synthase [Tardiphaga sp.]
MTPASDLRSGKTHKDENFPVASWVIHPRHRALILAFYNFVRTADDIADHASLDDAAKLALLDELEADLLGQGNGQPEAVALRSALAARAMPPRHALDVLTAFRMDVTKRRYADWDELIHYCSFSAMPVGRFMLDVHGESQATWPASDALCAALQINNHLQDCGDDYRALDRVYIPSETLARHGASIEDIKLSTSTPALRACFRELAAKTETLMVESESLVGHVADVRLGCEISVIQTFSWQILKLLKARDPLSENVHLSKPAMAGFALVGLAGGLWRRATGSAPLSRSTPGA